MAGVWSLIRAVTFDADGTLWDFERTMHEALAVTLIELQARMPRPRAAAKPDRHLFELAMREIRCEPAELVHVGDSLPNDVAGARALGIRAVWLNRDRLPNTTGIVPDAEIATLAELPGLVR